MKKSDEVGSIKSCLSRSTDLLQVQNTNRVAPSSFLKESPICPGGTCKMRQFWLENARNLRISCLNYCEFFYSCFRKRVACNNFIAFLHKDDQRNKSVPPGGTYLQRL